MTKPEFEQKSARIKQIYADFLVELDALKARRSKLVTGFTNKLQGSRVEQIREQVATDTTTALESRPGLDTLGSSIGVSHEEVIQADQTEGLTTQLDGIDTEIST